MGADDRHWFATFMVLDVSGSITASQYRRLTAPFTRFWRLIRGA